MVTAPDKNKLLGWPPQWGHFFFGHFFKVHGSFGRHEVFQEPCGWT